MLGKNINIFMILLKWHKKATLALHMEQEIINNQPMRSKLNAKN